MTGHDQTTPAADAINTLLEHGLADGLPRRALPSMAICPAVISKPAWRRCSAMHPANAAGSMAWKTREKVLAQGMPWGSLSVSVSKSTPYRAAG